MAYNIDSTKCQKCISHAQKFLLQSLVDFGIGGEYKLGHSDFDILVQQHCKYLSNSSKNMPISKLYWYVCEPCTGVCGSPVQNNCPLEKSNFDG